MEAKTYFQDKYIPKLDKWEGRDIQGYIFGRIQKFFKGGVLFERNP